jgi:hypothetical protein
VGFDFEGIGEMGVGGVLQCSATSAAGHDTLEFTPGLQVDCEPWDKVMEPLLFTQTQELTAPADALRHIPTPRGAGNPRCAAVIATMGSTYGGVAALLRL